MPPVETSQTSVVRRLIAEGWSNVGGARHDKFVKLGRPPIIVPAPSDIDSGRREIDRQGGRLDMRRDR